jgi:hypothetical protein
MPASVSSRAMVLSHGSPLGSFGWDLLAMSMTAMPHRPVCSVDIASRIIRWQTANEGPSIRPTSRIGTCDSAIGSSFLTYGLLRAPGSGPLPRWS